MQSFFYLFLVLILTIFLEACGGGGSSSASASVTSNLIAAEVDLTKPGTIVRFENGSSTVSFDITFDKFFACIPDGHVGIMLHADLPRIETAQYRGAGAIFGKFENNSYATRNFPDLVPVAVTETWAIGAVSSTFDFLNSSTLKEIHDGTFQVVVHSLSTKEGNRLGYKMVDSSGQLVVDVDEPDLNPVLNTGLKSLALFNASDNPAKCSYSVVVKNLKAL